LGTQSRSGSWRRWGVGGIIGCLLIGTATSPKVENQPTWTPQFTSAVAAAAVYLDGSPTASGATRTPERTVAEDTGYLSISARTAYQATTAYHQRIRDYTVKPGDNLWLISQAHDTDLDTVWALNPGLASSLLQPGQVIKVAPGFVGIAHRVEPGETLSTIGEAYGLSVSEILEANGLSSPEAVAAEILLLLPGAKPRGNRTQVASRSANRRTAVTSNRNSERADSSAWIWPITGGTLSSEFGARWGGFHSGLDIATAIGTPAVAVGPGTVSFAGWDGGYGYSVTIDHGGGLQTRYSHASELLVAEGETVNQGDQVILVGNTGNSTGPHLHFEVLVDGSAEDPRDFLP